MNLNDFYKLYPLRKITIREKVWEYIATGSGQETFLILPGGGQTAQATFDLIQAFENDYKVIAITIHNVDSIQEVIDAIELILSNEKTNRIILYGLSLGGMLAQSYLKRYKDKIDFVILSHTCPPTSTFYKNKIIRRLQLLNLVLPIIPSTIITFLAKNIARKLQDNDKSLKRDNNDDNTKIYADLSKEYYQRYFNKRLLKTWIKLHFDFYHNEKIHKEDYIDWKGKVLVLKTDNDPLIQDEDKFINIYPDTEVYTFKGTGHLTFFYKSKKIIERIKKFIKNQ